MSENTTNISIVQQTTSVTIWQGGYVTDNWSTYYLDKNLVKHKKKPKNA